jgi:hypothetical protein
MMGWDSTEALVGADSEATERARGPTEWAWEVVLMVGKIIEDETLEVMSSCSTMMSHQTRWPKREPSGATRRQYET